MFAECRRRYDVIDNTIMNCKTIERNGAHYYYYYYYLLADCKFNIMCTYGADGRVNCYCYFKK